MKNSVIRATWTTILVTVATVSLSASQGAGATCAQVVALVERGFSFGEISNLTGVTTDEMQFCIQGNRVSSPVGPAPHGAAGPAPHNAAGAAPHRAAGPAPHGAAGPAPSGAAGPAPHGAAGASPFGSSR